MTFQWLSTFCYHEPDFVCLALPYHHSTACEVCSFNRKNTPMLVKILWRWCEGLHPNYRRPQIYVGWLNTHWTLTLLEFSQGKWGGKEQHFGIQIELLRIITMLQGDSLILCFKYFVLTKMKRWISSQYLDINLVYRSIVK